MIAVADLLTIGILKDLPLETLTGIIPCLTERSFDGGTRILYRGDPGYSMFMILSGSVAVTLINEDGIEYTLTTLGEGRIFGEMALLTGEPRSANVKALSDVRTAELNQEDFLQLVSTYPKLYESLLRLVAQRRTRSSALHQLAIFEREEIIANFFALQAPDIRQLPGKSRATVTANEAIAALAATDKSVLILGERGAGKVLAARLIHLNGRCAGRPLFHLDCANPPPILREEKNGGAVQDALHLELAQESALFGHGIDAGSYAKSIRRGFLELADGGAVVLENSDCLSPGVQQLLVQYSREGAFLPRAGSGPISSRVRLIATSSRTLEELGEEKNFDPELLALVSEGILQIKPLRIRKKDIPVLAEHFLDGYNQKYARRISGFSDDALSLLVEHDWPLNVDELQQVVERAVVTTSGDIITGDRIFVKLPSFSREGRFNLLRIPLVRKLLLNPMTPAGLRLITVPFMILLIVLTLAGPAANNPANLLVWSLWEPLLILSVFFAGRSWCACCPLSFIAERACGFRKNFLAMPVVLARYGPWIATTGLIVILESEHLFSMFTSAHATGILLLVVLAGALVTTILFGNRSWCKHFCPLGMMVSQFTTVSPLELGANHNVCANQCDSHDCVKEGNCPMGLHPSTAIGGRECVFCLSCLRKCHHGSARLNVRSLRLDHLPKRGRSDAFFAILVLGAIMAQSLTDSGLQYGFSFFGPPRTHTSPGRLVQDLLITLSFAALVFIFSVVSPKGERKRDFGIAGYPYIFLALSGLLNRYLHELIYRSNLLPALWVQFLTHGHVQAPWWLVANLGTLKILPPLITLAGGGFSLMTLKKYALKYAFAASSYRAQQVLMILIMLILLLL
jgi:DNA-binding NtrC family response regulator